MVRDFNAKLIMNNRPSWDKYFMDIAKLTGRRSTCLRRSVGCVLVKSKDIISTGYNGAPAKTEHCIDAGCKRENSESGKDLHNCVALHAEQNAILQALSKGLDITGSTLYVTTYPCTNCCKLIVQTKIAKIIVLNSYSKNEIGKKEITCILNIQTHPPQHRKDGQTSG